MRGKRCCTFPRFNTGIGIGIVETSCSRRTNCQCIQYALGTSANQARQRSLKQLECHARSTTAVLNFLDVRVVLEQRRVGARVELPCLALPTSIARGAPAVQAWLQERVPPNASTRAGAASSLLRRIQISTHRRQQLHSLTATRHNHLDVST